MKGKWNRKTFITQPIIFIVAILFIGLMGVGYAMWDGEININTGVKTGHMKASFFLEDNILDFPDGQLDLSLSENKDILYVKGEIYSDFDWDIPLTIINEGSVPSLLKELEGDNGGVTDLEVDVKADRNERLLKKNDKIIKPLKLNIRAYEDVEYEQEDIYDEDAMDEDTIYDRNAISDGDITLKEAIFCDGVTEGYSIYNDSPYDLEDQIEDLKEQIRMYKEERHYKFEYRLGFEQDI